MNPAGSKPSATLTSGCRSGGRGVARRRGKGGAEVSTNQRLASLNALSNNRCYYCDWLRDAPHSLVGDHEQSEEQIAYLRSRALTEVFGTEKKLIVTFWGRGACDLVEWIRNVTRWLSLGCCAV